MPTWKQWREVQIEKATQFIQKQKRMAKEHAESYIRTKAYDVLPNVSKRLKQVSEVTMLASELVGIVDTYLRGRHTKVQMPKHVRKDTERFEKTDDGFTHFQIN